MQFLDRLVMDELDTIDAFDEDIEDAFDSLLEDKMDVASDNMGPSVAIGVAGLVLSGAGLIQALTSSGGWRCRGPVSVSYMRRNPRHNFRRIVCDFSLIVFDPPETKELWFRVAYDTNGKDLCDIRVQCLPRKFPSLVFSSLEINFEIDSSKNSPKNAEIAQVCYKFNGIWDPAFAYSYAFSGNLIIRADSTLPRLQILDSEENTVNRGKMQCRRENQSSGACASIPRTPSRSGGSSIEKTSLPHLRRGSRGSAVKLLQQHLNRWLSQQPYQRKISEDGVFGHGTEVVVRDFQKQKKLQADGIVGPKTWGQLVSL